MTINRPLESLADETALRADRFLELIAPRLQRVEEELRRNFVSPVRTISDVGQHILAGGGKRLRPALLLLCSDLLGYRGSRDIVYAAVVEFIHTATLVHDDIIDEAAVRRGRTSINFRWGNHLTVLVGDYLYTHAMRMALSEGNLEILHLLTETTIRMTEGEIIGLEQNGRVDLTIEEYFELVGRKTAALFGTTCQIPAVLAGLNDAHGHALASYGNNLGVCFQLVDDLLDFTSSTEVLGKPVLSDLKEGKLTLPLLLAMPHTSAAERALITRVAAERSFGPTDPEAVLEIVVRHDGLEQARAMAREYGDRAHAALADLPAGPQRDALDFAVEFVLTRDR